jgi:hypothetical protein
MDRQIRRKIDLCEHADNAEWDDIVVVARHLSKEHKLYLREHPPGLVKALWLHFEATRDRCGCATASHERSDCAVPLVQRLLLDLESA